MKKSNLYMGIWGLIAVMAWTPVAYAGDKPAATVNGVVIGEDELNAEMDGLASKGVKISREAALEGLIRTELLRQKAVQDGLDKEKAIQLQLELSKNVVLAKAALKAHLGEQPVSDKEIGEEYANQLKHMPDKQYHLDDIHTATADEARAAIQELADGKDFAEVAHRHPSGKSGDDGDVGWYALDALTPEIRGAVSALKVGAVTQVPIQVGNFWHVIKLAGIRDTKKPGLEAVRAQIVNIVMQKREQEFIDSLRKQSKVVIN